MADKTATLGTNAAGMSGNNQPVIAQGAYPMGCTGGGNQVASTLYAAYGTKWNGNAGAYNGDNFVLAQPVIAFAQNQRDEVRDLNNRSGALQAQPGMKQQTFVAQAICLDDQGGSRTGQGYPCIIEPAGFCTEHSANSRSIGYEPERSPTLRAGVTPAVCYIGTDCAVDRGERNES